MKDFLIIGATVFFIRCNEIQSGTICRKVTVEELEPEEPPITVKTTETFFLKERDTQKFSREELYVSVESLLEELKLNFINSNK